MSISIHTSFRSHPRSTSNGDESVPVIGLASFSTKPNTYNYSTGFRDSSVETTTTKSGYYEDVLGADPHGQSMTTGDTGRSADTGNRKSGVMRVLPGVGQGAAYESIDDAMPAVRQAVNTDSTAYDDVTEGLPHNVREDKPVHATSDSNGTNTPLATSSYEKINDPVTLMTPADETVVIDNCIYEGGGQ